MENADLRAITRGILDGSEPSDSVGVPVRGFGVAITDDEILITVDAGNIGLLRLVASPELAKDLVFLVAKAVCEHDRLCL